MGEVFDIRRKQVCWDITIEPGDADRISIREIEGGGVVVFLTAGGFERLDDLRKQAEALLKQQKRGIYYVD